MADSYLKHQSMSLIIISKHLNLHSLSNCEISLNISHNSAINEEVTTVVISQHKESITLQFDIMDKVNEHSH